MKIMASCEARHEGQGQDGASANAVSPPDSKNVPGRDASGRDASGVTSELKPLGDRCGDLPHDKEETIEEKEQREETPNT